MSDLESFGPQLSRKRIAMIFAGVVLLWAFTPAIMYQIYPNIAERGQVGDLFGAINALFSGLAFAGVIIAILLQRKELELQREELAANRAELARAATAQEESRKALQMTIYAQAYKTATDILQEERVRQARKVVLTELSERPYENWTEAQRLAGEIVCNTYDVVAIMIRNNLLPAEYIADSWGDSLQRTWTILKPLVEFERRRRTLNEYWDDYEYLAQAAITLREKRELKATRNMNQ